MFVKQHLGEFFSNKSVLDVGSGDINGNNRFLFENCTYEGNDVFQAPNVTVVSKTSALHFDDNAFDTIVSTECFEHDPEYAASFQKIVRMLRPGGLFCFTCASTGRPEHGTRRTSPVDSWGTIGDINGWQDYYKNLEFSDLNNAIPVQDIFSHYAAYYNASSYDLYFWGIKKGGSSNMLNVPVYIAPDVSQKNLLEMSIANIFHAKCNDWSDIYEHLPTLKNYASQCTHITECGVRGVTSSWAFAAGIEGKPNAQLVQVDLDTNEHVVQFGEIARAAGINVIFYQENDLTCPIAPTELLFIDTWHVYGQLKRELERWHSSVSKWIILHDTTVDEWHGETIRNEWNAEEQSAQTGWPIEEINKGLWPAVEEFLIAHPEWIIEQRFTNNNGLTVLRRI